MMRHSLEILVALAAKAEPRERAAVLPAGEAHLGFERVVRVVVLRDVITRYLSDEDYITQ